MNVDQLRALRGNHSLWLRTGMDLLAASDLLWTRVHASLELFTQRALWYRAAWGLEPPQPGQTPEFNELVRSGQVLPVAPHEVHEHIAAGNAYLLSAGYAVENLLKALRVKRLTIEKKRADFGRGSDQLPTNHRYVELAKAELGELSIEEVHLLRRLSLFVRWAGRYPVPSQPNDVEDVDPRPAASADDRAAIHQFCQRIGEKYESLK